MEHHIVIIGAGPRGTYCFRRVALRLKQNPLKYPVHIHIVEKSGNFGGGGIHSVTQPDYLLLNTIGSQITAFGDDDEEARFSDGRKTLFGYLAEKGVSIGPNEYPSRAQHGQYLAAMFDWTEKKLPPGAFLHRHHAWALDIEPGPITDQHVTLDNGVAIPADEVVLLTGHGENRVAPGTQPESWLVFAEAQQKRGRRVSYIHLVYPTSDKTRHIEPGDSVYVIGMGLTAVDVVKTLTIGRGGRFEDDRYIASGREPFIILGSRLGLPYSARAHNQKIDQYKGRVLTTEWLFQLKKQKNKIDFVEDLLPVIIREMEYVYYSKLMVNEFGKKFLNCLSDKNRIQMITENIPKANRFSWKDLENPLWEIEIDTSPNQPIFASLKEYTQFVLDYMRKDIEEAVKGNLTSPLKTALDAVLRDLRDTLRLAVDGGGLTADSHRYMDKVFNRTNNRVAVGPPVSSTQELFILAQKGIVSFSGPNPRLIVDEDSGNFIVESDQVTGSRRSVQHVLNGRIHSVDNKNDTSPLIQNLFKRGLIRTFINKDETGEYEMGGLDVTDDFNIIDSSGQPHPHVCALGIPIEGKFWFNAVDARPDVNSNAIGQLSRWADAAILRLKSREESE